jgi:hypothetical protein
MSNTPAHKLQDGALRVTIWRNTSDKGTFYTATPSRGYKSGDDAWKETDSLNESDLLDMAELLREAKAWIKMQKRADAKARKEQAAAA